MSCAETERLVELALDGELDARASLEVEQHLAACAGCERHRANLLSLRAAARAHLTRFEPPLHLRRRLERSLGPRRSSWTAAAFAAASLAAILAIGVFTPWRSSETLVDEIAAAHVRSLQVNHLTDVTASDQHVVKPWFQGKLDFGVPVRDFAADGFPLVGGRLDYLGGRAVAAVVYRHASHFINVFAWPSSDAVQSPRASKHHGFTEIRWTQDGLALWLVGDAAEDDLKALAALISSKR